MPIKNKANEEVSEAKVLMEYFGRKEGQPLAEFYAKLKSLTPEAKTELAVGAAKELGYSIS